MNETDVVKQVVMDHARQGIHLFRNNSGTAFNSTGRPIYFGLGHVSKSSASLIASSDLIGFKKTPYGAIFMAVEVKKPGWKFYAKRDFKQAAFLKMIHMNGGIAYFTDGINKWDYNGKEVL